MARKKKRKKANVTKQLQLELTGILFIFLSIFGSGASMISDGFIPTSLENIFRLLFGIWYFVASVLLFIIGITLVNQTKVSDLFYEKKSWIYYSLFRCIIVYSHFNVRKIID